METDHLDAKAVAGSLARASFACGASSEQVWVEDSSLMDHRKAFCPAPAVLSLVSLKTWVDGVHLALPLPTSLPAWSGQGLAGAALLPLYQPEAKSAHLQLGCTICAMQAHHKRHMSPLLQHVSSLRPSTGLHSTEVSFHISRFAGTTSVLLWVPLY